MSITYSSDIQIVDIQLTVNGTTNSTNSITGALIVAGGVGITKDVYINQIATINNDTNIKNILKIGTTGTDYTFPSIKGTNGQILSYSSTSNGLIFSNSNIVNALNNFGSVNSLIISDNTGTNVKASGINISGTNNITNINSLQVNNDSTFSGILNITNSTQSISTSTGALIINGGASIAKNLNIGESLTVNDNLSINTSFIINDTTQSINNTTGALINYGGMGIVKNVNIGGILSINNTTSGALTVDGGAGIAKNLNVNGDTFLDGINTINNTTNSTSTTTGSLVVDGGVGIAKDLYVNGNLTVNGTLMYLNKYFMSYNNSTINVSSTTYVSIPWNIEVRKDALYTHTTNSTDIVISSTGTYKIVGNISTEIKTGNGFNRSISSASVYINGIQSTGTISYMYNRTADRSNNSCSITILLSLTANDIINIRINRISGTSTISTVDNSCRILISRE